MYYTPEPVVSYIVRSLHILLKEKFHLSDGFASDKVTVLDPAAGTLTFLAEATRLAVDEFLKKIRQDKKLLSKYSHLDVLKYLSAIKEVK